MKQTKKQNHISDSFMVAPSAIADIAYDTVSYCHI